MSHSEPAISASYAFCRRMARRSGSNFYTAFLLLPPAKRRAMDALYAFMRHTDDLADNPRPAEERRQSLARWRASLEAVLPGGMTHSSAVEPLLPALRDTIQRFGVPIEHLMAVVDGAAMDLDRSRYETFDELVAYCERVASAVGLACIHVWGFRGDEALKHARTCGIAFQLTNILRDLKEDAAQGRVYLPQEDLRRFGYSGEELAAGVADDRFERLMAFQVDRVRQFYREGAKLWDWLEPDGRPVFGMMRSVYCRLLERIARRPSEVFRRRVALGRAEKLLLAARWALLPPRRTALP